MAIQKKGTTSPLLQFFQTTKPVSNEILDLLEMYESLLSEAYEGIIILDKAGYIKYTNEKHARYLKIPRDIAQNRHITDITDTKTAEVFLEVLRTGTPDLRGIVQAHGKEFVANRVAIKKANEIIGVAGVILFDIKEADLLNKRMIRLENRLKFFMDQVKSLRSSTYSFADIVGESVHIKKTIMEARRAAMNDATVLILGDSGTGKELFAHAIHNESQRKSGPLIKVNCSALPRELLESELFGYEPGAFTGAIKEGKKGKFELADKGSIFLDEIGDMPLPMQSTLLRVLQEKEVDRIGGVKAIKTDFRLIAATNKNLEESIKRGEFRKDLYYRLNVVRVELPSLRQRVEDIPFIVDFFLDRKSRELGNIDIGISPYAIELLKAYDYPGNVRELFNILERIVNRLDVDIVSGKPVKIGKETVASVMHPPMSSQDNVRTPDSSEKPFKQSPYRTLNELKTIKREQEKDALKRAIELTGGNLTKSAKLLGIHRTVMHRKIKTLALSTHVLTARKNKLDVALFRK